MKARLRGAALLVAVILIVTVAAFAVIVAASQTGSDIQGNDEHADSVEALFLAEAGVERALKRYATDAAACDATLAETITDLSQLGIASGRTIAILAGLTTDFNGAALAATQTQCRVRVTATIDASSVSRTIHAIVDRNLLDGVDNPSFDNPLTGATPSGWLAASLDPVQAFAQDGGADGAAPNCSRAAWTARDNPGAPASNRRATATANVQFTLTAGSVTRIDFYRRVISRTSDCGALPPAGPASLPAACGAGGNSTVCFQLAGAGGPGIWTVGSNAATTAGPGIAACPTTFDPCSTSYPGYPAKDTLNVAMTGATSVSQFIYWLQLLGAGRKEIFLDHMEVTNPTAIGAAYVRVWRDCSTAADPATCL